MRPRFAAAVAILFLPLVPVIAQQTPVEQIEVTRPRVVSVQADAAQKTAKSVVITTLVTPVLAQQAVMPVYPVQLVDVGYVKLLTRKEEEIRFLKSRTQPTAFTGDAGTRNFVTLAVLDPATNKIHEVNMSKDFFLKRGSVSTFTSSLGQNFQVRIVRANGVNTAVAVFDDKGRSLAPLLVQYPVDRGGKLYEVAYYTSAHPALMKPEVIAAGKGYLHSMLDAAARRLHDKGQIISPQVVDIAERLCVVEHSDHARFFGEDHQSLFEEIFALYALNDQTTYRYAVSVAGAGGIVQMIPPTYQMVRKLHPAVGLNPDFVVGMQNHGNALEAMLLYMQDTWTDMLASEEIVAALQDGSATQPELMAAGYNSNPARIPGYLRRGGSTWRTLIPRETQIYLQIYKSLDTVIPFGKRG